jgi:hypothetical protein
MGKDISAVGNPLNWRPPFIREIREHANSAGMLAATREILQRDNIAVRASGNTDAVEKHHGGYLFVGNHNKQFEFVALMDFLSRLGCASMVHIVKFYVERQAAWALGEPARAIVLPVYPRLLASDRRNKLNAELGSRILFHRSLRTLEESSRLNEETLRLAASELSGGGIVNIFPCGSIVNNMTQPWRPGVGRMIGLLPNEVHDDILVVPYHANNINRTRLLATVAMQGRGLFGRPQTIDLEFGEPRTVTEVIRRVPEPSRSDPSVITEVLRQQYCDSFA